MIGWILVSAPEVIALVFMAVILTAETMNGGNKWE
jgi:hypothetical protein